MKQSLLVSFFLITITFVNAQNKASQFFNKADVFFKTYIKNGSVDYGKLHNNKTSLQALIDLSNQIEVEITDANTYKAFWINVYNLGVIEQIVANYPVNSPLEISGFFEKNKRQLGGENITLNAIENKLLREQFKEPRFHFVLVCGAVSCPPIVNYAYTPDSLENQLEKQTKLALNNKDFIKVKGSETEISEIFSWYKQDFGNSKKNIAAFINKYRTLKIDKSFGYYTYNWQLNEVKKESISNTIGSIDEGRVLSNVQTFTPSKLLAKHQFDVKWFNSLYTQTRAANSNGDITSGIARDNFFTSTLEFYYGITDNARVNVGFITQGRSNTFQGRDPFTVFEFEDNAFEEGTARSGITTLAPSVRIQPFGSVPNFSFTSSVFFPLFEEDKPRGFLDKNSIFWETKFFFDHTFGANQWQIFTEVDLGFNFGDEGGGENFANNSLGLPISAFLSYFPSNKSTVFVNGQQFFLIDLGNNFD